MIKWLMYLPIAWAFTLICYLTNWLVVLFADQDGELDGFLHYWQTWDDSLDSEFFMREVCPSWLDYGYDEHYVAYTDTDQWTEIYGKPRRFSMARYDAEWTLKQRIQRYFCRVWWLYRNCAYGFMFFLLGADMTGCKYIVQEDGRFYCKTDKYFCYKNEQEFCKFLRWKIYLGWKTYPGNTNERNCMFAYRLFVEVV